MTSVMPGRAVGRNAGAVKYDVLTALGAFALTQDRALQILVLRLILLITARYNWQRAEFCVGRPEMARLWGIDVRQVKRIVARLLSLGWIEVRRAGARGRITTYTVRFDTILSVSEIAWDNVGADFVARMREATGRSAAPEQGSVVPFPTRPRDTIVEDGPWGQVRARIAAADPALYAAWIAPLVPAGNDDATLLLRAPSRFHASYVATHHAARLLAELRLIGAGQGGLRILPPG
ncbi:DnaA N-terminal domain-containing protein [Tropicimonas sp. IMCC34043]|uniref:DnaA N-terminal domain-containing protein n=1 Tax=Tropicimonas sp. IMCC34043 TaxID=2248760 RepID=UPI000E277DE0|nr:DnaA N-terminal domain-containing protein [Tropicimonas sp. IMCC34043]